MKTRKRGTRVDAAGATLLCRDSNGD